MRGKRVASVHYKARHLAVGKMTRRRERPLSEEERAILKLVVCGAVFVLIVMLKLLFPETVANFSRSASLMIGTDADFKEVFAAMGRAASGEETVGNSLQDVYTAVFNPSSVGDDAEVKATFSSVSENSSQIVNLVSDVRLSDGDEPVVGTEAVEKKIAGRDLIRLVPEPPENASYEQRNLGFFCTTPVKGTLTSSFGWREHPVVGDLRFHYGLDLAAETGTQIVAFADGEVFATGESSTLGKYIILTHSDGYKTLYGHCNEVLKFRGNVSAGEVIATVGESGTATGPHLHFELQKGTLYLNPIYYVDIG